MRVDVCIHAEGIAMFLTTNVISFSTSFRPLVWAARFNIRDIHRCVDHSFPQLIYDVLECSTCKLRMTVATFITIWSAIAKSSFSRFAYCVNHILAHNSVVFRRLYIFVCYISALVMFAAMEVYTRRLFSRCTSLCLWRLWTTSRRTRVTQRRARALQMRIQKKNKVLGKSAEGACRLVSFSHGGFYDILASRVEPFLCR